MDPLRTEKIWKVCAGAGRKGIMPMDDDGRFGDHFWALLRPVAGDAAAELHERRESPVSIRCVVKDLLHFNLICHVALGICAALQKTSAWTQGKIIVNILESGRE